MNLSIIIEYLILLLVIVDGGLKIRIINIYWNLIKNNNWIPVPFYGFYWYIKFWYDNRGL